MQKSIIQEIVIELDNYMHSNIITLAIGSQIGKENILDWYYLLNFCFLNLL